MRHSAVHDMEREIVPESCVVRRTHAQKGRTSWLKPGPSPVSQLHYGRIILDPGGDPIQFENGTHETGLICLKGGASVLAGDQHIDIQPYDSLYIPRDSDITVRPGNKGCDLAEISAPVDARYPLRVVRYAEIQRDPSLHFKTGSPGSHRVINILLGKNIEAGRIVAGVTFSEPGNWTSWPPHEHAAMLEEAYLFIDMPAPAWGVQFVYTNPENPELIAAVREGDCVVMPKGYHPNVAAPGGSINFLWMMAAHREAIDRQFGVVNVQPEYATGASGLEAGRADRLK